MLSRRLIFEMIYWLPLVVLLVSSLGLVALRRVSGLPPWLERVAALPFYVISLPIATLLAGVEMLAWTVVTIQAFGVSTLVLGFPIMVWLSFPVDPAGTLVLANYILAPFAVSFLSIYTLWRTIGRKGKFGHSSSLATRPLGASILSLLFVWAFLSLRFDITFVAPSQAWHLRIF
jgi:hypothetical protein